MKTRVWLGALTVFATSACLVTACGDDDDIIGATPPDGGQQQQNEGGPEPQSDGGGDPDATAPGPAVAPLATSRIENAINPYGMTFASDNMIYVSGATIVGGVRELAVWRYSLDGVLDATFNTTGVVTTDIPGNETSYDILEVSPGNFVVHSTVGDQNNGGHVFLTKLTTAGTPAFSDTTKIDFEWSDSDAGWPGTNAPSYVSWGIGLDKSNATSPKIVVFAHGAPARVQGGGTQRIDNDRWVARVDANTFAHDPTFGDGGTFNTAVDGTNLGDNARRGLVLADGTIYSAGYTSFAGVNNIVVIKLQPNGQVDPAFGFGTTAPGVPGQTKYNPFPGGGFAEAYGVVRQSSGRLVTTGYGTSNFDVPSKSVDMITTGLTANGVDGTFGKAGAFAYQSETDPNAGLGVPNPPSSEPYRDRGRDLALLPDDRIVVAGVYDEHAAIYVFDKNGNPDKGSGVNGLIEYAYPGNFFKIAVSPDGKRVAATAQSLNQHPDASAPLGSVLTVLKVGQ